MNPTTIQALLGVIVGVAGFFIHRSIKTPRDSERAQTLSAIASSTAALVLSMYPNATWAVLFDALVKKLGEIPSLPTQNRDAIKRVAAEALLAAGVKPGA